MKFDALEDIAKARKAKGLAKWAKLEAVSDLLGDKKASDIVFTCSFPGQEGAKKYLGSYSGDKMFLLGYVNPGFCVAPYHWAIVDANMSKEDIAKKEHPANLRYWEESGLESSPEGDVNEGKPHPAYSADPKSVQKQAALKEEAVSVKSGYGTYTAIPSEQRVYSKSTGQAYPWGIAKESYFAADNLDLMAAMDGVEEERTPEMAKSLRLPLQTWHEDVYPLVKSIFPVPGSVVAMGQGISARIAPANIHFVHADTGEPATLTLFDRDYTFFDITKGGDVHPSLLVSFADQVLGLSPFGLLEFVEED